MSANLINADGVGRDLDAINTRILDLLRDGQRLYDEASAALTDEAKAAGVIVCAQPAPGNQVDLGAGPVTIPVDGGLGPITAEQLAALRARLDLLGRGLAILRTKQGNAAQSYEAMIQAGGRRWRVG